MDEELWETENYARFLAERQRLLAGAANALLDELLHDAVRRCRGPLARCAGDGPEGAGTRPGRHRGRRGGGRRSEPSTSGSGIRVCPEGHIEHELAHPETGDPLAILDLAWPGGLQEGYSEPVALLLGEEQETLQIANDHGFRHFTDTEAFKRYAQTEVLAAGGGGHPVNMRTYTRLAWSICNLPRGPYRRNE